MNKSRSSRGSARKGAVFGSSSARRIAARQHDHRIGAAIAKTRQRPGDHQPEIGVRLHVEEGSQRIDRSAGRRHRQRLHSGSAAKAQRRVVDHPPALSVNFHRLPGLVAEVEI
jgi:hypothetical protein